MIKIGLNGYGRIGRVFHRISLERPDLEVVVINSRGNAESHAHLFKYDSTYGVLKGHKIKAGQDSISVDGKEIRTFVDQAPGELNWAELGVDIVVEATGAYRDRESCKAQLDKGAKKVVITAPGENEDVSIVMGVNDKIYNNEKHDIISNASCTTNALSLLLTVLDEAYGIESALVTTAHALTSSQNIIDNSHRKNLRLARSAHESIIPSTTGASKAVVKLMPHLEGKLTAKSLRVPLPTVSMIDLFVNLKKSTNSKAINKEFTKAASGNLNGLLRVTNEPLVSHDFLGETHTTVVDGLLTEVVDGTFLNLVSWYDNEWGYTERLADLVELAGKEL